MTPMFDTNQHLTAMLSLSLVHTFSPAYTMAQLRQIYEMNRGPIDILLHDPIQFQQAQEKFSNEVANIIIIDKSEVF